MVGDQDTRATVGDGPGADDVRLTKARGRLTDRVRSADGQGVVGTLPQGCGGGEKAEPAEERASPSAQTNPSPPWPKAQRHPQPQAHLQPQPQPRPQGQPTSAPKSFGRFELVERIGAGGMAEVFRAEVRGPEGFRRELVVKRVLPHLSVRARFTQMFVNEAKISAFLSHPNIVQIFEFGESEGSYFIAMESVRGLTLRETLNKLRIRGASMPVVAAMEIAREILMALDYAHNLRDPRGRRLDIVHRDISPSNVMLGDNGAVKVLDFGIARAADVMEPEMEREEGKVVKGKIAYLAPEQISFGQVDHRVDLFALGCVLFEMLTGRLLFRCSNDLATKVGLLRQPSPPPSTFHGDVPPAIDAIVAKAVERNPTARYASAADMLVDVENYLSSFRSANRAILRLVRSLGDVVESVAPETSATHATGVSSRHAYATPADTAGTQRIGAGRSAIRNSAKTGSATRAKLEGAADAERVRVNRAESRRQLQQTVASAGGAAILALGLLFAVNRGWGSRAVVVVAELGRRTVASQSRERPATRASVAQSTLVLLTFVSTPDEAAIVEDGSNRRIGTTPATLPMTTAAGARARFRIEKDGFVPITSEVALDADQTVTVDLVRAPARRPAVRRAESVRRR